MAGGLESLWGAEKEKEPEKVTETGTPTLGPELPALGLTDPQLPQAEELRPLRRPRTGARSLPSLQAASP